MVVEENGTSSGLVEVLRSFEKRVSETGSHSNNSKNYSKS
jgi:hypothetical protein